MSNINSTQQELLSAIQIIAENEAKKIKFTSTVLAVISKVEDESIGKYLVREGDAFYIAFSGNLNVSYKVGESVYVEIPNSNYSNTKMIIGSVNQLGTEYINVIDDKDKVNLIGINCFNTTEAFQLKSSTVTQEKDNYIDITPYINKEAFNLYIIQSIGLMISMNVTTSLVDINQNKGNYGLKLTCEFEDNNGQSVNRIYYLDTTKMVGNPFKLTLPTNQYVIYDMDVERFKGVVECILFAKDFAYNGEEPDIFIENIEMNFVEALTEEELSSYALNLRTVKGTIFSNASDDSLPMLAELKIKGKTASLNSTNSEFYWFVEDPSVDFDSPYYSSYGDRGWRCLNEKLNSGSTSYFVSAEQQYNVTRDQVPMAESTFKGVVVYSGVVVNELKKFQNLAAAYSISIESSKGTEFYFDAGNTELTCKILNAEGEEIQGNYTFVWGRYDYTGSYIERFSTEQSCTIAVNSIVKNNTFRCSVFDEEGNLFGTGNILLTNKIDAESGYTLVIENSTRLFYYDENGDAPTGEIPQLKLTIYDPKGNLIDLEIEAHKTQWTIPKTNTLLVFEEDIDDYLKADSLVYRIAPRFDKNKTNNTISVEVNLRGVTLQAETSFIFTKEGNIGTNGTSYFCNIIPSVSTFDFINDKNEIISKDVESLYFLKLADEWKVIYISTPDITNNNARYHSAPQSYNSDISYFKVDLYKEGRLVESGLSYNWYVGLGSGLVNYYGGTNVLSSMLNISGDGQFAKILFKETINKTLTENIIKVRVRENNTGSIFYSALPITIAIDEAAAAFEEALTPVNDGFGANEVLYSTDGSTPKYNSEAYFKVQHKEVSWQSSVNLGFAESTATAARIKPVNAFVSEVTNNYVLGYIDDNSYIIYPVIMHLNTTGFGMLNDWDGSKFGVNGEDGDYILAPQVGAGIKDSNNMFTGLMMGDIRNKDSYSETNTTKTVGLFGYNAGKQMFSLTPYNSQMKLGLSGYGQIVFDGESSSIQSGKYQETGLGMRIDLLEGKLYVDSLTGISDTSNAGVYIGPDGLRIGNKNSYLVYDQAKEKFNVKGNITADSGFIGGTDGWTIASGKIYNKKDSLNSTTTGTYLGIDGINIGSSSKYFKYSDATGLLIKGDITADSGKIGNWEISGGNLQTSDGSVIISPTQLKYGSNFKVDSSGKLTCSGASFKGTITGSTIKAGKGDSMFIATPDGISIGNFIVVEDGGRMLFESDDEWVGMSPKMSGLSDSAADKKYSFWCNWNSSGNYAEFRITQSGKLEFDGDMCFPTDSWWAGWSLTETLKDVYDKISDLQDQIDSIDTGGDEE